MERGQRGQIIEVVRELRQLYQDHKFCIREMKDLKRDDELHKALEVAVDAINEKVNDMYSVLMVRTEATDD